MDKGVKPCIDCPAGVERKTTPPGPRCAAHHKAEKDRKHDASVVRKYGLLPGEYAKLKEAQGGKCALCQRATGKSRRLAVDHDHKTGKVRGLLCSICNRLLGHFRDDPEAFERGRLYLTETPYERMKAYERSPFD